MMNSPIGASWAAAISEALVASYRAGAPEDVLERAAIQTFDALACAAGAVESPPVRITRAATSLGGSQDATILFTPETASVLDAVLVNGTAIRYLDYNDSFIQSGPGGHPSDNIAVALAIGEHRRAKGERVLTAIALGYELFWRARELIYARATRGSWDGVSVSGLVSAAMTGLLLNLDARRLTHALAIGAAKGYALKQVRRGSISMLKASANALVARDGVLAAQLAAHGMTGPLEVFEGKSGLLAAFGVVPSEGLLEGLATRPRWAIRDISIKPYPAIATAQSAIHAAIMLSRSDSVIVDDISEVVVRVPDSKATREHLGIKERARPDSRETADHSIPFLVACALEDGRLGVETFDNQRWLAPSTASLMDRISVIPDTDLASASRCYPAIVRLIHRDGRSTEESVLATPGSPDAPWGFEQVRDKFAQIQRLGLSNAEIDRIMNTARLLPNAENLGELMETTSTRAVR